MTPHEQMNLLDKNGKAYTVGVSMRGVYYSDMDVVAHSDGWLQIKSDVRPPFWVNMAHVYRIEIREV